MNSLTDCDRWSRSWRCSTIIMQLLRLRCRLRLELMIFYIFLSFLSLRLQSTEEIILLTRRSDGRNTNKNDRRNISARFDHSKQVSLQLHHTNYLLMLFCIYLLFFNSLNHRRGFLVFNSFFFKSKELLDSIYPLNLIVSFTLIQFFIFFNFFFLIIADHKS